MVGVCTQGWGAVKRDMIRVSGLTPWVGEGNEYVQSRRVMSTLFRTGKHFSLRWLWYPCFAQAVIRRVCSHDID